MRIRSPWKKLLSAVTHYWRPAITWGLSAALLCGVLWYRLGSLVPAFSQSEISTRDHTVNLKALSEQPLNAPHAVLQFIFQHFNHHGPVALRIVSTLFGLMAVVAMFYVLYKWYSYRVAILGSLLMFSSAWFLHTARLATTDVMMTGLFILFACGVWLQQTRNSRMVVLVCAVLVLGLMYVPGLIWFILPSLIWQRKRIFSGLLRLPVWQMVLLGIAASALLIPLVWALVTQPDLYKAWLGLPSHWPHFAQIIKNLFHIPIHLFWHGPNDPTIWLGKLPLIDWFGTVMFAIGLYSYWYKLHLDRTWSLIFIAVVGAILVSIGGPVTVVIFMPFIYLVIASGIALMLQQWFTVFPRNPFARTLGATFLILAVLSSASYNMIHYFQAWPHTPETKAVFQEKP